MESKAYDKQMRSYETGLDQTIPPELWMVVRLDGISFTTQTKRARLAKPFDRLFGSLMSDTAQALFRNAGFQVVYAYTMSDEISLLIHPMDETYGRKTRKILSCLAGQTSAVFQRLMDENFSYPDGLFAFDARISVLPHEQAVVDYFRWRQSEATRNCINAYCYWRLRDEGKNKREATSELRGMSFSQLNEFLFKRDTNFNDLPLWERRGIGHYFEIYRKAGKNKKTKKKEVSLRRRICADTSLPKGDEYDDYLRDVIRWGTTDDRTGQLMGQEQRWFVREQLPDLLKTEHAGEYAVVYEQEVINFFEDEDAAYGFGLDKFGLDGQFLLIRVEEPKVYWG